ncbi:MAG: thioredoxin-disulfide reductase [Turicibacter sp.]|nr:thioredoxin-disulfide reductase [Turicibacter sp.]
MNNLIIVGAGTAGLTAAIYGVRAGLDVTIIEKAFYGGQIVTTHAIDNYPGLPGISGADFSMKLYKHAKELGAKIVYETIKSADIAGNIKQITTSKGKHEAQAIIIATGATPRKLDVPGEEQYTGRGVSYCATCDGALYRGKDVAIVGGGNVAIEDAIVLSDLCQKVTIIHRRAEFRADKILMDAIKAKDNVKFLTDCVVDKIVGDEVLNRVTIHNKIADITEDVEVSAVFVAVGTIPDNSIFAPQLSLDEAGYVIGGEDCHTNIKGVFIAGDARTKKVRQLVTAAADGAVAALAAKEYLSIHRAV